MELESLLDRLGYSNSATFLPSEAESWSPPLMSDVFDKRRKAHVIFRASTTQPRSQRTNRIDLSHYLRLPSHNEDMGDNSQLLVWNQDIAPSFWCNRRCGAACAPVLNTTSSRGTAQRTLFGSHCFNKITGLIELLNAKAIDSGRIWQEFGTFVRP